MQSVRTEEKYLNLELPRKIAIGLLFALLFLIPVLSYAAQPINNPEFWIKKLKNADETVLTADQIGTLNTMILESIDHMADMEALPDVVSGDRVFEWLWTGFLLNPGVRYDASGQKLSEEFLDSIAYNMGLDSVAEEAGIRFGVVVTRGDIRALPTDTAFLASRARGGFDTIQYTSAHPSEPVALLHVSRDGEWGFFQTATLRGWMRLEHVAFGEREDMITRDEDFLVVTGSKVKVFRDAALKSPFSEVKMGSLLRFDAGRKARDPWKVLFPEKGEQGELIWTEAYLSPRADVHEGFLPYTRRNIITQAFKMLGEEYGWGGKDGRRDCSLFIKDLFATVGLNLPRNSRQQGSTGDVKASAAEARPYSDVANALRSADPGITLLTLNGHVMLHIGDLKGKPYVIHQIFGYNDGRRMKLINKTAVTGLDLGRKSRAGSFKKRLKSVTEMTIPPRTAQASAESNA
ncbi:hypothetical protein PLCT1_01732 [Planctomycetaceae bacterium]|nr:hypothetical protein PLCT1_01732 [Planctomycetaceae bacterium]